MKLSQKMYDIEADWVINSYCNFCCSYCFNRSDSRQVIKKGFNDTHNIMNFFDSSQLSWHIHFTGGEPFLFPDFLMLCKRLTQKHWISINTNLSSKLVFELADNIDPKKIIFIHAGLHIQERERLNLVQDFIAKVRFLQQKEFKIFVSYVLTPALFNRFHSDFEYFQEQGITVLPKILRKKYQNKEYPDSYTVLEKNIFKRFSCISVEKSRNIFDDIIDRPLIDLRLDAKFIDGIPCFHGKKCMAGSKFVQIDSNGTITRCGSTSPILGNVYLNKLCLMKEADICETHTCPYFCAKYEYQEDFIL